MNLKKIGYFSEFAKDEVPYVLLEKEEFYNKTAVLEFLRGGIPIIGWQENRECCFGCGAAGEVMGHHELSDGEWIWTDDIVHYIECHNIDLPREFVEHIGSMDFIVSVSKEIEYELNKFARDFDVSPPSVNIKYIDSVWVEWIEEKRLSVNSEKIEKLKKSICKFNNMKNNPSIPDEW